MKTVNYPIHVPSGKYCWTYSGEEYSCKFFDNEGGHATCNLNFDNDEGSAKLKKDGVPKAKECLALKDVKWLFVNKKSCS